MQYTHLNDIELALLSMFELEEYGFTEATPSFFRPFHFILLALTVHRCGLPAFEMADIEDKFTHYASRMQLWDALGQEPPVTVKKRDSTGRFHPLTRLDNPDTVDSVGAQLARLFSNDRDGNERSVDTAVSELVGNAYAHSNITTGLRGLVCAQRWNSGSKAQIAIGDNGIGIRNSLMLSDEYKDLPETINACEFSTQFEVTSKRGKGHAGYGLTLARQLIENNGGAFFLVSNDEYYFFRAGISSTGRLKHPLQGTMVVFEWNTNAPLSTREVYDSWSATEGNDDDDFDF